MKYKFLTKFKFLYRSQYIMMYKKLCKLIQDKSINILFKTLVDKITNLDGEYNNSWQMYKNQFKTIL